jgi:hypothetical protein
LALLTDDGLEQAGLAHPVAAKHASDPVIRLSMLTLRSACAAP